jgi:hypothetical protein
MFAKNIYAAALIAVMSVDPAATQPLEARLIVYFHGHGGGNVTVMQSSDESLKILSQRRTRVTTTDDQGSVWWPGYFVCRSSLILRDLEMHRDATVGMKMGKNNDSLSYLKSLTPRAHGKYFQASVYLRPNGTSREGCMMPGQLWECGKRSRAGSGKCKEWQPGAIHRRATGY